MRVRVSDVRLFVDVEGSKLVADGWNWRSRPTLVLLHGGPGFDHLAFRQPGSAYERVHEFAQVVYVDLRGCGASDVSSPQKWNLSTWAADIVDLCGVLGIERPVLVGESGGGWVALELLRQAPDLPAGLVLESSGARWSLDRVTEAFRRRGGDHAAETARSFWTNPNGPAAAEYGRVCMPCYAGDRAPTIEAGEPAASVSPRDPAAEPSRVRYNHAVLARFANEMHTTDYRRLIASTNCPMLVIAGEHDPICPIEDAADIAALGQHVTYLPIAGAGHDAALYAPEVVRSAIRDFLHTIAFDAI